MRKEKKWIVVYCLVIVASIAFAQAGSRAVAVISQNTAVPRKICIVLDAGHGGEDGGAISCTGKPESMYNLEITLRLNDLLNFLGYDTRMIRTSDVSVYTKGQTIAEKKVSDLKERVRIVNETNNGILISIHQNTFPEGKYQGAQVFYSSAEGSEELAKVMQGELVRTVNPGSRRMAKKASRIYLMEHIGCTGVLVECGFLSNPEEEAKLRTAEYQKKICSVIAASVSTFLSNT